MTIEDNLRALEEKAKRLIVECARLRQREHELVKEIEEISVSTLNKDVFFTDRVEVVTEEFGLL